MNPTDAETVAVAPHFGTIAFSKARISSSVGALLVDCAARGNAAADSASADARRAFFFSRLMIQRCKDKSGGFGRIQLRL